MQLVVSIDADALDKLSNGDGLEEDFDNAAKETVEDLSESFLLVSHCV